MAVLKSSWEIEEDIKNTAFSEYPEMEKCLIWYQATMKPKGSVKRSFSALYYRTALQSIQEAVQDKNETRINLYITQIKEMQKQKIIN